MRNLLITIIILLSTQAFSQTYSTKSKRAIKYFEQALNNYRLGDYEEALYWTTEAIDKDNDFVEAHLLEGEIYTDTAKPREAAKSFSEVIRIAPDYDIKVYFRRAQAYLKFKEFAKATADIQKIEQNTQYAAKYRNEIDGMKQQIEFMKYAIAHPVQYELHNLGDSINTENDEYWPSLTIDEKILIFTRLVPTNVSYIKQEDFYISRKKEDKWIRAKNMGRPMNTKGNEGAQSISANGKLFVYTVCDRPDANSCDLYVSYKDGNRWTTPKNIGAPVNTRFWESQPSVSADGRTIYFVSNRPGTYGGMDIWYTTRNEKNQWNSPKNMGTNINTSGNETSPFIHPDDHTLYFASTGHIGMGGSDIFKSSKTNNGWSSPQNLGYPINTEENETGLIVNTEGMLAYIASNRQGGNGGLDLYWFELPPEAQPNPVTYIQGKVYDAETNKPLQAELKLVKVESAEQIATTTSDYKDGEYLMVLPLGNEFAFHVEHPGYMFFSENFALKNLYQAQNELKSYLLDIPLQPIKKGSKVILKNVFFDTDKYSLKQKSYTELNKLVQFLTLNPSVKIEIGGHTDNAGTTEHNKTLSQNRAKTVYEYLIEQGISAKRLSYNGYGETQPVATNETKEGRALNRRTEFKITD